MQIAAVDNPVWKPYLYDWWGNSYSKRIVRFEKKYWFVKYFPRDPRAAERERLAYLLGRNLSNIAEIRVLNNAEFGNIKKSGVEIPADADRSNTYLVRLGFDYRWWRLPIKNLEHAVAAELVFSTWIRRRDAHSFNRIYVRGIPVFFDHLTGLLGEPELANIDKFFFRGPDAGYAAWWQIEEKRSMRHPDLLLIRRFEKDIFAAGLNRGSVLHQVRCKDRLRKFIFEVFERIRTIPSTYLQTTAVQAGFNTAESREITHFLRTTADQLEGGVERLCSMFNLH